MRTVLSVALTGLIATISFQGARAAPGMGRYDQVDHPPAWYDQHVQVKAEPPAGADRACLERLHKAHIKFRFLEGVKGVKTPVEVLDRSLGLVRYKRSGGNKRRFILACHTVEVLAALGRRIRAAGVSTIHWSSAWRYSYLKGTKTLSEHAFGRALDIVAIEGRFGYATVKRHYERGRGGCGEKNKTTKGKALRRFCCALTQGRAFATLYTPDTDADHRDHLHVHGPHLDIRHRPRGSGRGRLPRYLLILAGLIAFFGGAGFALYRNFRKKPATRSDTGEAPPSDSKQA